TSACGSSRSEPVGFHSSKHHYSVQQVEAAFANHGIRLKKVAVPREKLLGGGYPNVTPAEGRGLIRLAKRPTRVPAPSPLVLRGLPPHRDVEVTVRSGPLSSPDHVVVNSFGGAVHIALIHHGDLTGSFDDGDRDAVNSALAELH